MAKISWLGWLGWSAALAVAGLCVALGTSERYTGAAAAHKDGGVMIQPAQ